MQKSQKIISYIKSFLIGATIISTVGTFQKMAIDILPQVLWYLLPVLLGGSVGMLVKYSLNHYKMSKKTNEALKEIVPCAVMTLDKNRVITGWNKKAEEITGLSENDVLGKKCKEVLCEKCDLNCDEKDLSVQQKSGINRKIKTTSGKYLSIYKTSDTLVDDHGNIITLESFIDISKFVEAEEKLIYAKKLAEKSNRLKSEFLAQMSHEIRTPVNSVLSFTSLVKADLKTEMTEDMEESFEMIDIGGKRIIRTIDLILDMAQLNTKTFDLLSKFVMLVDEIVNPIYKEFKNIAESKGLKFELIKEKPEYVIKIDPYVIGQILINLVDNAVKFTTHGTVQIKLFEKYGKLNIEIADTGIGMSSQYKEIIYEPFTQEEQGYARRYEGNGLGLSLVKKYCDLIGAEIKLESKINVGTKFKIEFPKKILEFEKIENAKG